MSYLDYALIVCAALTMTLIAFPNQARSLGWRTGAAFVPPAAGVTTVAGLIAVALIVHVLAEVVFGARSFWWLLIIPVAALGGGAVMTAVFGRNSGMIALVGAPASYLLASYFNVAGL